MENIVPTVKFCAISDLHGHLELNIDACDYLLISGDVCPDFASRPLSNDTHEVAKYQFDWLRTNFATWVKSQPIKNRCILTWGNHDWVGQHLPHYLINTYLQDFNIDVVNDTCQWLYVDDNSQPILIHGYPWTPEFYNWAFNLPRDLDELYALDNIHPSTNILLSHGPILGRMGQVYKKNKEVQENLGSAKLTEFLINWNRPELRYVICGHIHDGSGHEETIDNIKIRNCAICNESYKLTNKPYYFEMKYNEEGNLWL